MTNYRFLQPGEIISESDERAVWVDYGLMGGARDWELVPPWMIGDPAMAKEAFRRPVDTEKEALKAALKTCLHVIEKGIEVRMMDQWPVLQQILPDAVKQAKDALGIKP